MELMPLCKGPRELSSSLLSVMERYNQKTGIGKPKIRPSSDSNSTYKSILDFLGSRSVRDKVLSFKPSSLGKSVAAARAKNYPGTNHVWQKKITVNSATESLAIRWSWQMWTLSSRSCLPWIPSPGTSGLIRVTKNSPPETIPQPWPSFFTKIKNLESKLRSSVSTR